jgi:hypothetical protein
MQRADCASAVQKAFASLYSYDDATCRPVNSRLPGDKLTLFADISECLSPNWRRRIQEMSDFHATLYCELEANILILAFRGSLRLTPFDPNSIDDWFATNLLQHLGTRPLQYEAAEDAAWEVKEKWRLGAFDGKCGSARPRFMLAGHSKGGGQAQYAAASASNKLDAIVFNSDPVNPFIFTDWAASPNASLIVTIARTIYSAAICGGLSGPESARYAAYFARAESEM